ncbi:extracellular tyrosine-protein kinase PKDCC-like [Pelobates fuscus]|uniref:extracellular tyrosine-protein kinase PKDCC-like n=1 Tax=Pelobates fuscus TaxID=191477 RepID=UPI002FE4C902
MKCYIIFSGVVTILIYLKYSVNGRWPYNDKHRSFLNSQLQNGLRQEILRRHEDLIIFYKALLEEFSIKTSPMDIELDTVNVLDFHIPTEENVPPGTLGCVDLLHLTAVDYIGSGFTKLVLKGTILDGRSIALKYVHSEGNDIKQCVDLHKDHVGCHRLATYKLQKEVALLQILRHPGIIKLHGQCYHNTVGPDIRVTAMMELGTPIQMIQLLQAPWEERFKICFELVQLLHYLANSPMGSIALLDFQPRQFVLVDGSLKVTDVDDAITKELTCTQDEDCTLDFPSKTFALKCSATGTCEGINEKRNLYNAYRFFFTYLLPHAPPLAVQPLLQDIMNGTGDLRFGINDTLKSFENVLNLYKSGMDHHNESEYLKDYLRLDGFRIIDNNDHFRCWPSYNHLGCLLSVHSAEEAAEICSNHTRCQNFVIGQQRTWTGRLLTSFTSGPVKLVPDVNSQVYVKKNSDS